MGYRNYLYKIKKKEVNKFRNMSLDELKKQYGDKEDDNWVYFPDISAIVALPFGFLASNNS